MSGRAVLLLTIIKGFVPSIMGVEGHREDEIVLEDWGIAIDIVSIILSVRIIIV
jgi:hypothetical protein